MWRANSTDSRFKQLSSTLDVQKRLQSSQSRPAADPWSPLEARVAGADWSAHKRNISLDCQGAESVARSPSPQRKGRQFQDGADSQQSGSMSSMMETIRRLQEESKKLRYELSDARAEAAEATGQAARMEAQQLRTNDEFEELRKSVEASQAEVDAMRAEADGIKDLSRGAPDACKESLERSIARLNQEVVMLEKECRTGRQTNARLEASVAELQTELRESQMSNGPMNRTHALEAKVLELEREQTARKHQEERLLEENKELRAAAQRTSQHAPGAQTEHTSCLLKQRGEELELLLEQHLKLQDAYELLRKETQGGQAAQSHQSCSDTDGRSKEQNSIRVLPTSCSVSGLEEEIGSPLPWPSLPQDDRTSAPSAPQCSPGPEDELGSPMQWPSWPEGVRSKETLSCSSVVSSPQPPARGGLEAVRMPRIRVLKSEDVTPVRWAMSDSGGSVASRSVANHYQVGGNTGTGSALYGFSGPSVAGYSQNGWHSVQDHAHANGGVLDPNFSSTQLGGRSSEDRLKRAQDECQRVRAAAEAAILAERLGRVPAGPAHWPS